MKLCNNEFVNGWDCDIIAEDYHMTMKCMAADFRQQMYDNVEGGVEVRCGVRPVWLPTSQYLVL